VALFRVLGLGFYPSHPGGPDAFDWLVIIGGVVAVMAISAAIAIPIGRSVASRVSDNAPSVSMSFQVGTTEIHSVSIAYTQQGSTWLKVTVDGRQIIGKPFVTGFRLSRMAEWQVGTTERHTVRVQKTRLRLYGVLRPQQLVATVDGVVVATAESRL